MVGHRRQRVGVGLLGNMDIFAPVSEWQTRQVESLLAEIRRGSSTLLWCTIVKGGNDEEDVVTDELLAQ